MKKLVVLGLFVASFANAETGTGVTSQEAQLSGPKTGLVFTLRPVVGFVNPKELNDLTTAANTIVSGGLKITGADAPNVSNMLQAEAYLGYAFNEDLDAGAFFSIPPVSSKKLTGTSAAGTSLSRTVSLKGTVVGLQGNYTFAKMDNLKFYGSPSVGFGTMTVTDKLDGVFDFAFDSKSVVARGALGAAYQFTPMFSAQLEGGYQYWSSGKMTHRNDKAGTTVSNTASGDLNTDLSGPFVGLGVTVHYPI